MQKRKNNKPRPKFTGSYKKKSVYVYLHFPVYSIEVSQINQNNFINNEIPNVLED